MSAKQDDSSSARIAELETENAELRRRIDLVDGELDTLRAESLQRRQEVRTLAESLPAAESRKVLLTQMANDLRHHPDKKRMAGRAWQKLLRGPRKLGGTVRDKLSPAEKSP